MSEIAVFKSEIDDGLAIAIQNNNSIAMTSLIQEHKSVKESDKNQLLQKMVADANPNQFDLFYLESVLASVGVVNKNDDLFTKSNTWTQRNTPVDKQFNFMHNEKDIIGHITSSRSVNGEGVIIPDNTPIDDVPDRFDIIVGSVLYLHWSDDELKERMKKIVAEIIEGKWFVSMECLFAHFDYALMKDGTQKVVARNDNTSWMTKHLRAYGGTGEIDGWKVYRALANFAFSGKGLVSNPANDKSIILNAKPGIEFAGSEASIQELGLNHPKVEIVMAENTVSLEEFNALKAELNAAKEQEKKQLTDQIDSVQAANKELEDAKAEVETKLENEKSLSSEKDTKIEELKASNEELQKKVDELQAKINEQEAEAKQQDRLSQLLKANVEEEKANEVLKKFANADDDMFAEVVELHRSAKAEEAEGAEEEDDKKKKKKNDKNMASESEEAEAEDDELDTEDPDDAGLANAGEEEDETEMTRTAASSWLATSIGLNEENK